MRNHIAWLIAFMACPDLASGAQIFLRGKNYDFQPISVLAQVSKNDLVYVERKNQGPAFFEILLKESNLDAVKGLSRFPGVLVIYAPDRFYLGVDGGTAFLFVGMRGAASSTRKSLFRSNASRGKLVYSCGSFVFVSPNSAEFDTAESTEAEYLPSTEYGARRIETQLPDGSTISVYQPPDSSDLPKTFSSVRIERKAVRSDFSAFCAKAPPN